jgi:hypothetical protein
MSSSNPSNDVGQAIVNEARKWLHVREIGANHGFNDKIFEAQIKLVGWKVGEPWCAYFAKLVWLNVYKKTPHYVILEKVLSGSVLATWRNAKASPIIHTGEKPVVGGIVCWGTGNGKGHEGIHIEIRDDFNTVTIEGNTSRAGVREGDKIMEKRRKLQPTAKHNNDWRYLGTIIPPAHVDFPSAPAV